MPNIETVSASQLKVHCLEYLEHIHVKCKEYIITKHGEPVAKLTPIQKQKKPLYEEDWRILFKLKATF